MSLFDRCNESGSIAMLSGVCSGENDLHGANTVFRLTHTPWTTVEMEKQPVEINGAT